MPNFELKHKNNEFKYSSEEKNKIKILYQMGFEPSRVKPRRTEDNDVTSHHNYSVYRVLII